MVKGIGPVYAKKLVERFGEKIFDVIGTESARLESVGGIGPKRRRRIKEAWAEQKAIRESMVFLHSQRKALAIAVRNKDTPCGGLRNRAGNAVAFCVQILALSFRDVRRALLHT